MFLIVITDTANCMFFSHQNYFGINIEGAHFGGVIGLYAKECTFGNYISLGTQEKVFTSTPSNEVINDTNIEMSWRELKFTVGLMGKRIA